MPCRLVILALNAPNEEKVPVQLQQPSQANYCLWIEACERLNMCPVSPVITIKTHHRTISPASRDTGYFTLFRASLLSPSKGGERREVGSDNCGGGWHELWPLSAVHWPPCSPQPAGIRVGETPPTTPLVTLSTQSILIQKILFPDTKIILSPEIPLLDVGGCHHALW